MNQYILKSHHEEAFPNSHFFDKATLKFFGETMSSMRVLQKTAIITDVVGNEHSCYVLTSLQRAHPISPRRVIHYFDINTFEHVIPN